MRLCEVPVDPVQNVQPPVATQKEDVVPRKVVYVLRALHEHQLRQDGHRLQINGEGPQDFCRRPGGVDHQRQQEAGYDQEHVPKCVLVLVVRLPHHFVDPHVVNDAEGGCEEDDLHDGVVSAAGGRWGEMRMGWSRVAVNSKTDGTGKAARTHKEM